MKPTYIPTLDGWRAIAISLVVFAHALPSFDNPKLTTIAGLTGVRLFFGLSGFLITSLLLAEEKQNGKANLIDFYVRRFFRIMPAAFVFLAVVALLSVIEAVDVSPRRWLETLFFFANYSSAEYSYTVAHFWSLAVEEHFYFIWPTLFVALITFRKRVWGGVIICAAVAAWRVIAWKYQITMGDDSAKFLGRTDINFDALLWGAVLAILATREEVRRVLLSRWSRILTPIAWLGLIVIAFMEPGWKVSMMIRELTFILSPVLIFQVTRLDQNSFVFQAFEWQPVRWVGKISYSLYLWQQLFLTHEQDSLFTTFPLNLMMAVFCAVVSYYLIERPCRTAAQRLFKRPSPATSEYYRSMPG